MSRETPSIARRNVDNREVIEILGKNFVLSNVLASVERIIIDHPSVEEVRFVGDLSIDANLANGVWHGRNVVVMANEIKVCKSVRWDVSGKDSNHSYGANAGTATDGGHGRPGTDGYAGEAGGNVTILTRKINSPEKLTIISNGGRGSNGQDGGDGSAGQDGKGICGRKLKDRIKTMDAQWWPAMGRSIPTQPTKNPDFEDLLFHRIIYHLSDSTTAFNVDTKWSCDATYHGAFYEFVTEERNAITYSLYSESLVPDQGFLVCKGSRGTNGSPGGQYGLGGQGGLAGEITVEHIDHHSRFGVVTLRDDGSNGTDGRGGLVGRHGKNGWDVGRMDYDHYIPFIGDKWPKYYGLDERSTLSIEYFNESSSDRVYCPYKGKYAEIKASALQHHAHQRLDERNNTRPNRARQRHAIAARKNPVLRNRIMDAYSNHLVSIGRVQVETVAAAGSSSGSPILQKLNLNGTRPTEQTVSQNLAQSHIQSQAAMQSNSLQAEFSGIVELQQNEANVDDHQQVSAGPHINRCVNFSRNESNDQARIRVTIGDSNNEDELASAVVNVHLTSDNMNLDDWEQALNQL